MTEELKIKLTVDTSSVQTTINKLKNEVSNINKNINSTTSSSSTQATNTEKAAKAQTTLTDKVKAMVLQLKSLKGMSVTDLVVGTKALKEEAEKTTLRFKAMQKVLTSIGKSPFISDQGKMFEATFKAMSKSGLKYDGSTGIALGGDGGKGDAFKSLQEGIKNAGSSKELSKLIPKMKELGIDVEKLGLSGSKSALSLKQMGMAMKIAGGAATFVVAAIGALIAALAILVAGVMKALSVSKLGDEIYHTASRFNMGTEAFQEWNFIMERAGGTMDDLTGFMETLASEQAAVIEGSEDAAANFKRLGLSMEQVSKMGQQELFETTVARIQQIEDATQRSAIAYSIFGDEASKFMNVLNMSNAEMTEMINNYHLLGGAMSGETLEASNKLQNSVAAMKEAWKGVGNVIAEVFMPIAQKLVEWLTKLGVIVQLVLKAIFGLDYRSTGAGDAMDKASGSTNKYAASTKKATKAAEELKRVTMGFDELNIVSDPNKSSGSSDAGASSMPSMGGMGLSDALPDMSSLGLDNIYAWFEEWGALFTRWAPVILSLLGLVLAAIGVVTGTIPLAIAGLALFGAGITIGIKSGAWTQWGEDIKKVLGKLGEAILSFFTWIGEKIAWLGKVVLDIIIWFATLPAKAFMLGYELGTKLREAIEAKLAELKAKVSIWWAGVKEWFNSTIKPVFTKEYWANKLEQMVQGIATKLEAVKKKFSDVWSNLKTGASAAWTGVKNVFGNIVTWFKDKFTQAWTAVKNVFSTGGKIFDGIKEGIVSTFKTVVNGLIGGINKIIKVPFDAINGMLNTIRSVSVAGVEPFKGLWKKNPLSVPQIPKLATGGIATGSILANIGENGREAVLPLENNTEWMDMLADRIAERNGAPTKVVLQVGEKELGWATINSINNITKQTGNIQLAL